MSLLLFEIYSLYFFYFFSNFSDLLSNSSLTPLNSSEASLYLSLNSLSYLLISSLSFSNFIVASRSCTLFSFISIFKVEPKLFYLFCNSSILESCCLIFNSNKACYFSHYFLSVNNCLLESYNLVISSVYLLYKVFLVFSSYCCLRVRLPSNFFYSCILL
jgi:hypothetical protein